MCLNKELSLIDLNCKVWLICVSVYGLRIGVHASQEVVYTKVGHQYG